MNASHVKGQQTWQVLEGDCLGHLRAMSSDSVDSLVTDPPAGIGFMSKDWDTDKGGRDAWVAWLTEVMRECHRVLKPGANGLVWAIPRTSHWTATALENAGFEIRDVITHLFGTGFPKSLDISKAIDKAAGAKREVVGTKLGQPGYSLAANDTEQHERGAYGKFTDATAECAITAPATDDAKKWQGFGTALKPACEMWWLVRKPLSEKTVAANVLKHGTGAINIDGCRVPAGCDLKSVFSGAKGGKQADYGNSEKYESVVSPLGRFPANLVLSHSEDCTDDQCAEGCAVRMLDEQSGELRTNPGKARSTHKAGMFGVETKPGRTLSEGNVGGASRFFYCVKASKKDRGTGNTHPTVKSTKLMAYLLRLVTPPGGVALDPFMGSGSTGVAAVREGFGFVGIERDAEHVVFAKHRLSKA